MSEETHVVLGTFTTVHTASGTMTNGIEMMQAGVTAGDSSYVIDDKINKHRRPVADTPIVVTAPWSAEEKAAAWKRLGWFVVALAVCCSIYAGISQLPAAPAARFHAFYNLVPGYGSAKDLAIRRRAPIASLQRDFGSLYVAGAPLTTFYLFCREKNCTEPDHAAFDGLERFALAPASYWSDVCAAMARRDASRTGARVSQGSWEMVQVEPKIAAQRAYDCMRALR